MNNHRILEKGKPLSQAKKAIILLHGRGGTAENIIRLADEFCDDRFYIAAPQAPDNSWYPFSFLAPAEKNEPWLSHSVAYVKNLIDTIAGKTGTENIYIMGFSQGACLALEVSGRFPARYAGIAGFTGGLIGQDIDESIYQGSFSGTKVFLGNSDTDPHVPLERSLKTKEIMEKLDARVMLRIYEGMPHTIIPDEIETVKKEMF